MLTMLAAGLDVSHCELEGAGLSKAIAGDPAVLRVKIRDQYSNAATPSNALKFIVSLQSESSNLDAREKRRKSTAQMQSEIEEFQRRQAEQQRQKLEGKSKPAGKSNKEDDAKVQRRQHKQVELPAMPYDGFWVDGQYEIRYVAQKAGDYLLHVWADPEGAGVREPLPGSPFEVKVVEAKPAAASSTIGYPQEEKKAIFAGEKLVLKPQLRDQFGNASAAPLGALVALLDAPDGPQELEIKPSNRGLGAYEISHESVLKGEYTINIELDGQPIAGSPGIFVVQPAAPTAVKSILKPPVEPPVTNQMTELELIAVDKLGNTLDRGGARIDARVLGPNAGPCNFTDRKNGTYLISFSTGAVGEYRVIARLDNVELAPLAIQFAEGAKVERLANQSPSSSREGESAAKKGKSGSSSKSRRRGADGSEASSDAGSRDYTPAAAREGGPVSAQSSFISAQSSFISAQSSCGQGSYISGQGSCISGQGSLAAASSQGSLGSDASAKRQAATAAKKGPAGKPLAISKAMSSKGSVGSIESSRGGAGTNRSANTNRSPTKDPKKAKVKFDSAKAA